MRRFRHIYNFNELFVIEKMELAEKAERDAQSDAWLPTRI